MSSAQEQRVWRRNHPEYAERERAKLAAARELARRHKEEYEELLKKHNGSRKAV